MHPQIKPQASSRNLLMIVELRNSKDKYLQALEAIQASSQILVCISLQIVKEICIFDFSRLIGLNDLHLLVVGLRNLKNKYFKQTLEANQARQVRYAYPLDDLRGYAYFICFA